VKLRRVSLPVLALLFLSGTASAQAASDAPAEAPPAAAEPASEAVPSPTPDPSAKQAESEDVSKAHSTALLSYQKALAERKLAPSEPLSAQRIRDELASIEEMVAIGRRDEAIGALVYLVESPRFEPFVATPEGRAAYYQLGDALGRGGAYDLSRGYLLALLKGSPDDTWYRQAVRSLVDFGLESDEPDVFLRDLAQVPDAAGEEVKGDIAYLSGRSAELSGKPVQALASYAKVSERSRFWAQATYLSGVIEVERKNLKQGEALFCKVADPKKTPKRAALFGGSDFFRVRDLARLGLGRVAHEQYRFDDARYYYYLVPADSERLPEALYETATTRYEAKDYDGARESMDDLRKVAVNHPYEDEAWILDAYIDLAVCRFPKADDKLKEFLKRYEPVRDAARKLTRDGAAMQRLVDTLRSGADPASANLGVSGETSRALGSLLRVDTGYGRATRRLAQLDHQLNGLRRAMGDLDAALTRLATPKDVKPASDKKLAVSDTEQLERAESQLAEVKRLIREAERSRVRSAELDVLRKESEALELEIKAARAAQPPGATAPVSEGKSLPDLLAADRARASALYLESTKLREQVLSQQLAFAKDAFTRLDKRLSRLIRRAQLGRIETVLGKKRALEIEVEALSQGLLPQTIVDSLDAERYLRDDEEYWPFEGEDWADEYVGGEGLR
jgi:hypothetical protein